MMDCERHGCNNSLFSIQEENNPLVDVYSCGNHITHSCSLCNEHILRRRLNSGVPKTDYITWHFMSSHTLKISNGNYLYGVATGHVLINEIYYKFGRICGHRFCNISDIVKTNPYFIYLVPEFSISNMLDQFDEVCVPAWQLLTAMRSKSFSCLICGGRFESFPSNEVFAAHKCKK